MVLVTQMSECRSVGGVHVQSWLLCFSLFPSGSNHTKHTHTRTRTHIHIHKCAGCDSTSKIRGDWGPATAARVWSGALCQCTRSECCMSCFIFGNHPMSYFWSYVYDLGPVPMPVPMHTQWVLYVVFYLGKSSQYSDRLESHVWHRAHANAHAVSVVAPCFILALIAMSVWWYQLHDCCRTVFHLLFSLWCWHDGMMAHMRGLGPCVYVHQLFQSVVCRA